MTHIEIHAAVSPLVKRLPHDALQFTWTFVAYTDTPEHVRHAAIAQIHERIRARGGVPTLDPLAADAIRAAATLSDPTLSQLNAERGARMALPANRSRVRQGLRFAAQLAALAAVLPPPPLEQLLPRRTLH